MAPREDRHASTALRTINAGEWIVWAYGIQNALATALSRQTKKEMRFLLLLRYRIMTKSTREVSEKDMPRYTS